MCLACQPNVSVQDEFSAKLLTVMNHAALSLALSLGHRARLWDTLRQLDRASSQQLATAAGLQERYVREWLGAVVTGGVVTYDPTDGTFHLPAAHAEVLESMAHLPQFIPVLAQVEDQVLACFQQGGGVPYEAYPRFHQVMAEESGLTVVAALHEHIVPLVPGLKERLETGLRVLDVGCGSGRALNELARAYPNSTFVGYDLSEEAVGRGRQEARGLPNLSFELQDVTRLDAPGGFDLVTAYDAIHDQAHPDRVLAGIRKALKPEGVFLMQDIRMSSRLENNLDHPLAPFIYTISCMHCMTVSLAQGGVGLGAAWGRELALKMLAEAGFRDVSVHELPHDAMNDYYVAR